MPPVVVKGKTKRFQLDSLEMEPRITRRWPPHNSCRSAKLQIAAVKLRRLRDGAIASRLQTARARAREPPDGALYAVGFSRAIVGRGCGSTSLARRAGIRAPRRHADFVWKLDRLARSVKQLIETIEELRVRGIGFRSLTEAFDTTTAQGRLVLHMFGALAEFERSLIREPHPSGASPPRGALVAREAVHRNCRTTTSRPPRRCSPIPTSA
jgi:hypothetical protein